MIKCLRKLADQHSITIVTSIHQPNTAILEMFNQLYVLSRGGVCIYSGPPSLIREHLVQCSRTCSMFKSSNAQSSQSHNEEEDYDNQFRYPIENLIFHSCQSYNDSVVQQLSILTNNNLDHHSKLINIHPVLEGVFQNRRRFSLNSVWLLSQRYLALFGAIQWLPMLFYMLNYLAFAYVLNQIFDPQIAQPSGCINMEEDFYNMDSENNVLEQLFTSRQHDSSVCSPKKKSVDKIFEIKQITNNCRYSFYMSSVCFSNIVLNSAVQFTQEFVYFRNEHRNGP